MKFKLLLSVLVGLVAITQGNDQAVPDPSLESAMPPVTTQLPETTSTTIVSTTIPPETTPTTSTTTKAPTTSTTTTTTSTTESTTPTTTTTTTPATTTTTPATTTTTVAPPSPSPAPVPVKPEMGTWTFIDEKKNQSILVAFAAQLNFTYENKTDDLKNVLYTLPAKKVTQKSGNIGDDNVNTIQLTWNTANTLDIEFTLNKTTKLVTLTKMVFKINVSEEYPDAKGDFVELTHLGKDFETPIDMSYHCTRQQTLNLTQTNLAANQIQQTVEISHLQLDGFHQKPNAQFSTAKDCDALDTPDIVPIAVGCALAALVIVVLIAYLVGRRRSQARGYVSM